MLTVAGAESEKPTGSGFAVETSPALTPSAPWISLIRWYWTLLMSSEAIDVPAPAVIATLSAMVLGRRDGVHAFGARGQNEDAAVGRARNDERVGEGHDSRGIARLARDRQHQRA